MAGDRTIGAGLESRSSVIFHLETILREATSPSDVKIELEEYIEALRRAENDPYDGY